MRVWRGGETQRSIHGRLPEVCVREKERVRRAELALSHGAQLPPPGAQLPAPISLRANVPITAERNARVSTYTTQVHSHPLTCVHVHTMSRLRPGIVSRETKNLCDPCVNPNPNLQQPAHRYLLAHCMSLPIPHSVPHIPLYLRASYINVTALHLKQRKHCFQAAIR